MSNKCPVPFKGTKEQEQQLLAIIAKHKDQDGPLMPVLQEAQEIYGYLPIEVQKIISEGLDIPLEHIYGVVTFYAQFSLAPKGEYKIGVCIKSSKRRFLMKKSHFLQKNKINIKKRLEKIEETIYYIVCM